MAKGLLAIRSHVDTSDPSLLPVRAMLEVAHMGLHVAQMTS